jgi:BNR repeat-like domain
MRAALRIAAVVMLVAAGSATAAAGGVVHANVGGYACAPATVTPDPTATNYPSAEVEPWVAVNPRSPANMVAVWQQDRWSNFGANGLRAAYTTDGGSTWTQTSAPFTHCTGGNASNNGNYDRATDPWATFSPDGTAYLMSLSLQGTPDPTNEMAVARSRDGGATWSSPVTLRKDTLTTVVNDKNAITADPGNSSYVYAVWTRYVFPNEQARGLAFDNPAAAFYGPTWFARTTNGGTSWEAARKIYDPATDGPGAGRNDEAAANQIVVLPDGTLVNAFNLIHNDNAGHRKGGKVAVIRSSDRGATWEKSATIVAQFLSVPVTDPATGARVRTGDVVPAIAVDRSNNRLTHGNLYAVWQDARFSGSHHDEIAFSRSTNGGDTWSAPKRISTPTGKHAFTPAIAVGADGTIGVVYYDFRNDDSGAPLVTDVWITTSSDGGATWSEQHVSGPFDMANAPVSRGYFVGDYIGLGAAGAAFHPLWVEATAADNVTDVFTATVTP